MKESIRMTSPRNYHRIDLEPAFRQSANGTFSGQGKAIMTYEGRCIGKSRQPLYAAARYLLAHDLAAPEDFVMTCRDGVVSMTANVGWAASKTVQEPAEGGIYRAAFRPFTSDLAA